MDDPCNCIGVYEVGTCKLRRDLGLCDKPKLKEKPEVEYNPEPRQDPELLKLAAGMKVLMLIYKSSSPEQCVRTILENKNKGGG